MNLDFSPYLASIEGIKVIRPCGTVNQVIGMVVEGSGPAVSIGGLCTIERGAHGTIPAEVVGFREREILLMPYGDTRGIEPGGRIWAVSERAEARVGDALKGRILDGLGHPIDGKGPLVLGDSRPLYTEPLNPMERPRITSPLDVGVKAINACLTVGKGQRIGIMAGSGVGKSTLLGMIARHTTAHVNVIALIGERGRELMDFIERDLGEEGLARSVVIIATSDQPPLIRIRGAFFATAVSEYFRDQGQDVILMMDSLTRFAMAYREVGLAIGEPPTSRGYTPTVFSQLPRLLERAGRKSDAGSITGIYTVLVEGDDMNEPIADAVRSIVDGHIVLRRELAQQGHYPAIDILASVSRVMRDIAAPGQIAAASSLVKVLAAYQRAEDLINLGAYVKGTNPDIDFAVRKIQQVKGFLAQEPEQRASLEESIRGLIDLFQG
ncbi:MAG: FliI/YscN family ATPase [Deltaproteobacteria bacterium]